MSFPLLAAEDLALLARGEHPRPWLHLGAHEQAKGGVRFAVWAPAAKRVSVVGDFNGWDGCRHALAPQAGSGIWCGLVPEAKPGDFYKYELEGPDGRLWVATAYSIMRILPDKALLDVPAVAVPRALRVRPNPSSGTVALAYEGADPVQTVEIWDVAGRLVRRFGGGGPWAWDGAGADGRRAAAGIYLARVRTGTRDHFARIVRLAP